MAKGLIGLGSNLGDRGENLRIAIEQLKRLPQTSVLAASAFRDTKPAGGPAAQPPYLNAAATIETSLEPLQLLTELQRIEIELGRIRTDHWGPRTIDLDLLLYDQFELETPNLTLPHPRMSFRRFVLEPAAEIAAEMVYPLNRWTIQRLLNYLNDPSREIVLVPTYSTWCRQAPATRLLKTLETERNVQQVFRRDEEALAPTPKNLERWQRGKSRHHRSSLLPQLSAKFRPDPKWHVADFWLLQVDAENIADDPLFDTIIGVQILRNSCPKLVVVWQPDDAPVMQLLQRIRHNEECPPVLWIPKVTLEQARQEVIAALAAME